MSAYDDHHDGQHSALTPRYPEGTPEYAAYADALRAELAKFAAGEPPYDDPLFIFEKDAFLEMQYEDHVAQVDAYLTQEKEDFYEEAAAFEDQRAFERWADDQILDDENADVSEQAYLTYLEGFFPDD